MRSPKKRQLYRHGAEVPIYNGFIPHDNNAFNSYRTILHADMRCKTTSILKTFQPTVLLLNSLNSALFAGCCIRRCWIQLLCNLGIENVKSKKLKN
jgi:hypothetical protein